jgi:hypothetical protein
MGEVMHVLDVYVGYMGLDWFGISGAMHSAFCTSLLT